MTLNEFRDKYNDMYEFIVFDDTDSLYQINITGRKDSYIFNNDFIVLVENDTFNIYTEFAYEDSDSSFQKYSTYRQQLLFLQTLTNIINEAPEINFDDGWGCPYSINQIGFFNIKTNDSLLENLLRNFEKALSTNSYNDINVEYIQSIFPNEFNLFNELKQVIYDESKGHF